MKEFENRNDIKLFFALSRTIGLLDGILRLYTGGTQMSTQEDHEERN